MKNNPARGETYQGLLTRNDRPHLEALGSFAGAPDGIFAPEYAAVHPVQTTGMRAGGGEDGDALSAGEEHEMRKFLQDLGYIE